MIDYHSLLMNIAHYVLSLISAKILVQILVQKIDINLLNIDKDIITITNKISKINYTYR